MTFTSTKRPLTLHALSPIAIALCALGSGAWAQTAPAPDAGRVLRDLQPAPVLTTPPAASLQRSDSPAAPAKDEARALVKSIVITGNQELPTPELQALVANLVVGEQTLSQLEAAARRITAYYRERGFAVARAYLPAQDISNGTVTISIVEGRIASHKLNNQARLSSPRADAFFGQIKDGDVIKSAQIDRGLLLLQDTPGVAASRATLQPGASVGTSELLIELDPAKAYGANLVLDNYGSRYTGEYRLGGAFNLASPLNIGDQLSFTGLTSGNKLSFGRVAYQLPLGSDGLRLGAAYFDTRYQLGKEFAALDAHGSASSASVFAAYPLIRSQLKNLSATAAYESKRLNDRVDSTATVTDKRANITSLGLAGNLQDALGGGGINSFELNLALGRLSINSPGALAIDAVSAQSNGHYSRVAYSASRLQRLTDATALSVSVNGQQASKNLDSSEKFSLGGANAVRAYPQGEAVGDEGHRATVELQHSLADGLQATVFYDFGQVTINKNPFGPPAAKSRHLAGAGLGLNASFSSIQLRSSLSWRTSGGVPTSIPAENAKRPTLWLQAALAL
jgi:hemolysin activation/secretion protein